MKKFLIFAAALLVTGNAFAFRQRTLIKDIYGDASKINTVYGVYNADGTSTADNSDGHLTFTYTDLKSASDASAYGKLLLKWTGTFDNDYQSMSRCMVAVMKAEPGAENSSDRTITVRFQIKGTEGTMTLASQQLPLDGQWHRLVASTAETSSVSSFAYGSTINYAQILIDKADDNLAVGDKIAIDYMAVLSDRIDTPVAYGDDYPTYAWVNFLNYDETDYDDNTITALHHGVSSIGITVPRADYFGGWDWANDQKFPCHAEAGTLGYWYNPMYINPWNTAEQVASTADIAMFSNHHTWDGVPHACVNNWNNSGNTVDRTWTYVDEAAKTVTPTEAAEGFGWWGEYTIDVKQDHTNLDIDLRTGVHMSGGYAPIRGNGAGLPGERNPGWNFDGDGYTWTMEGLPVGDNLMGTYGFDTFVYFDGELIDFNYETLPLATNTDKLISRALDPSQWKDVDVYQGKRIRTVLPSLSNPDSWEMYFYKDKLLELADANPDNAAALREKAQCDYTIQDVTAGKHVIKVVMVGGNARCNEMRITATENITEVKAEQIILNPESLEISYDASIPDEEQPSYTIEATVLPDNTTDKTVTWSSSNPDIIYVSKRGVVTAYGVGTATITATCGDVSAICAVDCLASGIQSIEASSARLYTLVGNRLTNTSSRAITVSDQLGRAITVSPGKSITLNQGLAIIVANGHANKAIIR
ncbi:MAG: Ig-like domain-containing protein [Bacteroidales bacterium]|nr:Ig-like domain-containing protein [Bacteroidales bacterium]